ncbi:ornithine carbamoyltransferase [Halococcus saccharolyticus]|uniref:Ornithine carbamoyltransferase n=1 Tax=Halococcus saccharolyticus DSM 5350 TaxID=1227455 RepID=M0ME78_9EURY|nr:ornithine carbamoyltransferase [Halococcus saccharolyticus]EMA42720.1 ornithine carbamoyltransferase [Halococcus saccharolyticus DSM 5350]
MTRHFTDIDDLSISELETVLDIAAELKARTKRDEPHPLLERRTLGMVFEKPSARTRISFETGMTQLGGHAIFLGPDDIGLGEREPLRDTARTLSGYVDCAMVRLFDHADLEELAAYADVPIVNGLTDDAHPCQTLADLLTLRETVGFDAQVAWVGDGNNVAQSFVLGCALAGIDLTVATPEGYGIDERVLDRAGEIGTAPDVTADPEIAVAGRDAVYTDVWVSMGEEAERETKLAAFEERGFQVNADLLPDDATVLHCLPAHRGEEITEDVLESDRAAVWQQAENRLHAQKGLLAFLLDAL